MALKVKAVERLLKFDKNDPGSYRYVLKPELYTSLDQKKVIREAAQKRQAPLRLKNTNTPWLTPLRRAHAIHTPRM